jgi:hypothetical protein
MEGRSFEELNKELCALKVRENEIIVEFERTNREREDNTTDLNDSRAPDHTPASHFQTALSEETASVLQTK